MLSICPVYFPSVSKQVSILLRRELTPQQQAVAFRPFRLPPKRAANEQDQLIFAAHDPPTYKRSPLEQSSGL